VENSKTSPAAATEGRKRTSVGDVAVPITETNGTPRRCLQRQRNSLQLNVASSQLSFIIFEENTTNSGD